MRDDEEEYSPVGGARWSTSASPLSALSPFISKVPEKMRHACTPDQILRRVFGIEAGWRCTGCARPYEVTDYVRGVGNDGRPCLRACPGCRKPLPRRCSTKGCGNLCEPFTLPGRVRGQVWYDPPSVCQECLAVPIRQGLAQTLVERLPAGALDAAISWQPDTAWRRALSAIVAGWAKGARSVTMVLLHGPSGTGKTVGACYALRRVFLALGRADADFLWTSERELLDAHRALHVDGDEEWKRRRAEKAVDLLAAAKTRPMVAIDEWMMGGAGSYTDRQAERMFEILAHRADHRLLTVITMNVPYRPDPSDHATTIWHLAFGHAADRLRGAAMQSRFGAVGQEIEANGYDRRGRMH